MVSGHTTSSNMAVQDEQLVAAPGLLLDVGEQVAQQKACQVQHWGKQPGTRHRACSECMQCGSNRRAAPACKQPHVMVCMQCGSRWRATNANLWSTWHANQHRECDTLRQAVFNRAMSLMGQPLCSGSCLSGQFFLKHRAGSAMIPMPCNTRTHISHAKPHI